jgi:flavin-dependent dehydrogenase
MTSDLHPSRDVIILGGGLAGLTLAVQLKQRRPETSVLVLEKAAHPAPEAAHKVGESSVEIGAHYLGKVLGLGDHLDREQLPKYGLRFYFKPSGEGSIEAGLEVGASKWPPTPSYQLDRGKFENFLGKEAEELGVEFVDRAAVSDVDIRKGPGAHDVHYRRFGEAAVAQARWVVDAAGRSGFLKRRLGLSDDVGHRASAAWFRVNSLVDIDEFSHDPRWKEQGRTEGPRHLSTNHLMGRGYWVWLIPLSSGSTSIGIVADSDLHPLSEFNSFDKAMSWLRVHQPECAATVKRALSSGAEVQDFLAVKHYARGCKQVFSPNRWALTGDAGVFLDPFYSPGSDFIAMSNTYITDLVCRDLEGQRVRELAAFYEKIYFSFFRNGLSVYEGMYPVWGNMRVMPIKVAWDYFFYWAIVGLVYFNDKLTDLGAIVRVRGELDRAVKLNQEMQRFFKAWDGVDRDPVPSGFLDQSSNETLTGLNRALTDRVDGEAFAARVEANVVLLEEVADEIVTRAARINPCLASVWHSAKASGPTAPTGYLEAAFAALGM